MIRHSVVAGDRDADDNPDLVDRTTDFERKDNVAFFAAARKRLKPAGVAIGLVGQCDIPGVALRRAQSVLRWNLRPSLWSHAFLLFDDDELREVPLYSRAGRFPDPAHNGVVAGHLRQYANPLVDANAALLTVKVTPKEAEAIRHRAVEEQNLDRIRFDLWRSLGVWQGYLWSAGAQPNPLEDGVPIAASALVEYCFEAIELDITPGAAERHSAPEHLWNAARWWHKELAHLKRPIAGEYVLRDRYAKLLDAEEMPPPQIAAG